MQKNIPKYKVIENDIIKKVNQQELKPFDALPSESELAELYDCSRVTVRQALSNLSHRGYITKEKGRGSFINKPMKIKKSAQLKSFTEEMMEHGKHVENEVKEFKLIQTEEKMASLLGIKYGGSAYYIERIRFADKQAVMIEKTYMSTSLHPKMNIKILENSKFKYAYDYGFEISYSHQNIKAVLPDDFISHELNIRKDQAIIMIENQTFLDNDVIFDYTELFFHPDYYELNIIKRR